MATDGDGRAAAPPNVSKTQAVTEGTRSPGAVRRFRLEVVEGPNTGAIWESSTDACAVGSHSSNDLVIDEPTVSRFHCEVRIEEGRARIRDLDSTNGVVVDGMAVRDAFLRGRAVVRLGHSAFRFQFAHEQNRLPLSERTQFGSLVGVSVPMRSCFSLLERAAATEATVLIEGETGTGKEGAAEAIHQASARRNGPLVVVDCSAIPPNLLESELFGHEKGAFTGAAGRHIGAFEEASGGTVFLDELGELPIDLQPKLLRVLEQREIRRIGGNGYQAVDVRVIAATNRDLRREVNAKRFRSDIYYRLAVVKVSLPALRQRPEDIPVLVDHILQSLGATPEARALLTTPEFLETLRHASWPGNVRELRNYLERCLVFQEPLPVGEDDEEAAAMTAPAAGAASVAVDISLSYDEARRRALAEFERRYATALVQHHGGKVAAAAQAAGMAKVYLYRLLQRHRVRGSDA